MAGFTPQQLLVIALIALATQWAVNNVRAIRNVVR
jgi:uncharacterized protein VirK/YbjX